MRTRFKQRGYPDYVLREAFKTANSKDRTQLLNPNTGRGDTGKEPVRVIATFDNASGPICKILQQHWEVLLMDPDIASWALSPDNFQKGEKHLGSTGQKPLYSTLTKSYGFKDKSCVVSDVVGV